MDELLNNIQGIYPDVTFKFDPTLTYEESIKGVRALRSAFDITNQQVFPLFTYTLGVLKPYEVPRKQFPYSRNTPNPFFEGKDYKARYCSFEIPWKWYYSDIIASKTFEVMFATETSINLVKNIFLEFTDIGTFEYQVVWDFMGLENVSYNKQDNLYMSCDGKCTITGEFIMLSDTPIKFIQEIQAKLNNYISRTTMETGNIDSTGTTWSEP
jgi:hypothetical protein